MTMVGILIGVVTAIGIVVTLAFARAALQRRQGVPVPEAIGLGAVTNFFDTLGIGSFAPTMAWFRFRKLVGDRAIPPTMSAGHTLPSIAQSIVFLSLLGANVDPWLLAGSVVALSLGVVVGGGVVARSSIRTMRLGIAAALTIAACLYAATNLGLMPPGGTATGLPPALLVTALAAQFVMGILINFGVGHYAPTLVLLSLMGMDPRLAFPIMATTSVAGLGSMAVAAMKREDVKLGIVSGMALGGIPAVIVAAYIVKSMPIEWLRWLVVIVVVYAAVTLFRAALSNAEARREDAIAN